MSVVVLGGGVGGAAASCLLARGGARVLLVERTRAPAHKICGEFISAEAAAILQSLGLDLQALGAHPITGLRLIRGDRVASATLPFTAFGLSRLALDEALLRRAAADGVAVQRGCAIREVRPDARRLLSDDGEIDADTLLLASGKHEVRGMQRRLARPPDALVGFKMHFRLSAEQFRALAGVVEVVLLRDGYAGLQCVEASRANLCLLVQEAYLQRVGGTWTALLADLMRESPTLRTRLSDAEPLFPRPLTIARVPYGHVHAPASNDAAGLYRLGDQLGVIPSFAGDGMAIALHSAREAARACLAGIPASDFHRRMRTDIARQIGVATTLYGVGRRPATQPLLFETLRACPSLLRLAARMTRVRNDTMSVAA